MCGKAKRTGQIRRGAGSVKTLGSTPGCTADLNERWFLTKHTIHWGNRTTASPLAFHAMYLSSTLSYPVNVGPFWRAIAIAKHMIKVLNARCNQ